MSLNIKSLSNSSLVSELKSKVSNERKILNEILEYLTEVSSRNLHLDMGYSDLFVFCMEELGYSRQCAHRRVSALGLLQSLPAATQAEVKTKIEEGSLNLTHFTTIQGFFKNEDKANKQYSPVEKAQILQTIENKSKLETERELVKISPQSVPRQKEKVRFLSEKEVELTLITDLDFIEMDQKLKHLKSHINPSMSSVELFKSLMAQEIKRLEPKAPKTCPPADKQIEKEKLKIQMGIPRSRYIPTFVKHKVWKRDNGECSYVNEETGEVCQSKHLLQYDHIQEFSKWGLSNDPKNIRLLCGAHNRHRNVMKSM